jgi:hypothetical protein
VERFGIRVSHNGLRFSGQQLGLEVLRARFDPVEGLSVEGLDLGFRVKSAGISLRGLER